MTNLTNLSQIKCERYQRDWFERRAERNAAVQPLIDAKARVDEAIRICCTLSKLKDDWDCNLGEAIEVSQAALDDCKTDLHVAVGNLCELHAAYLKAAEKASKAWRSYSESLVTPKTDNPSTIT